MNTKYFMFCLVNFMSFVNIHPFLSFRPATHSKKVGTVKHLPLVMLPFPFTTLKRRLGTEDTKWWSVSGVILSHSSCKQVLRWATVRGLRCRICASKCATTSLLRQRSGLQAGQSSTRTLFLLSQDFVMWQNVVLHCLVEYAWTSLEKMSSLKAAYCAPNLYVLFSINGAITEVQVTFAKGTDTTPYHDRPWLLDLFAGNSLDDPFLFGPEHTASIPPKKYLKYWFIWPQYNVSTVWWSIPDASEPREVDGASGHC